MQKAKLFAISILTITVLACAALQRAVEPTPAMTAIVESPPAITAIIEPTSPLQSPDLPATEDEVPRVSLEQALTAYAAGAAVFVDVRSEQSYAISHIAGAISIPLVEIETNPTGLDLDKGQWIITYCT